MPVEGHMTSLMISFKRKLFRRYTVVCLLKVYHHIKGSWKKSTVIVCVMLSLLLFALQVTSLELVCRQHESSLKDRDNTITAVSYTHLTLPTNREV